MANFLQHVADYLFDRFTGRMDQVCVVLPNRRAGLFLKKYLGQRTQQPIFAPDIYSIEDFVFDLGGFRKAEASFLLFDFYEVYRDLEQEHAGSFAEFIRWAEVVLRDFNDLDLALANEVELFGFLSESKALSLWNLDEKPLTPFELRYLRFFNSMADYHRLLKEKLKKEGLAYQGMAYRELATRLPDDGCDVKWKSVIFAGFNALSAAEEEIIRYFSDRGTGVLLWDADSYYLDDPVQEAGAYLRKNKKKFGLEKLVWTQDGLGSGTKRIELIGVPKVTGQAKVAGDLVDKLQNENPNLDDTCIVLNDGTLLVPLLNSLPSSIQAFNLTMGLPLSNTPLSGLIEALMQLNENAWRFDKSGGNEPRFYYKDLFRIFNHPYFTLLLDEKDPTVSIPVERILSGNQAFFNQAEIAGMFETRSRGKREDLKILFEPWRNIAVKASEALLFLLKKLKLTASADGSGYRTLDIEYIFHFSNLFNRLREYLDRYDFVHDLESFRLLYLQLVRTHSIPFYGEPLKGIQIMGMLETRNLDFKNVVMLSVNEDYIPGATTANSFIPFDIRNKFNLPTHRERNAVSGYHFYRLLQRAENAYLIYNTEPGDLGGGDKSRFITQIEHELQKHNPNIEIRSSVLAVDPGIPDREQDIVVEKDSPALDKIHTLAQKGFSASSLNAFRNCSLQFYFKHMLELKEADEVEETIEASTLGSVVHDALFFLYSRFKDSDLSPAGLDSLKPDIEPEVQRAFKKNYEKGDVRFGKNLLMTKVAESFVRRFIKTEKSWLIQYQNENERIRILDLEVKLELKLPLESENLRMATLLGFVDRIDRLGSSRRIIDYKTGKVESKDLRINDWEELSIPGKHDKVFQLMFYALLYQEHHPGESPDIGIISFKNLGGKLIKPSLPQGQGVDEALPEFRQFVHALLKELADPSVPFRQVEDVKVCEYCSFRGICNR